MLKIRRPLGRLIFNMGIAIPGKTVFLIETAPWTNYVDSKSLMDKEISYKNMCNIIVSTVLDDGLAPLGARASANTVMTNFGSRIYTGAALLWPGDKYHVYRSI